MDDIQKKENILNTSNKRTRPQKMTAELYNQRVKALVDDEYVVLKGFINQKEKVTIRHNKCGYSQEYKPSAFLDGQRCKRCRQMVRRDNLEKMLFDYSDGRYSITDYGKNLCTILDKSTSVSIQLPPLKILQEITRPTKSAILPIENEKNSVSVISAWEYGFDLLCEYKKVYGNTEIPKRDTYKEYPLGEWANTQRKEYKQGILKLYREEKLRSIGFDFDPKETEWLRRYNQYIRYVENTGSSDIARREDFEGEHLGTWVETQRKREKEGKLSPKRKKMLKNIGMKF